MTYLVHGMVRGYRRGYAQCPVLVVPPAKEAGQ